MSLNFKPNTYYCNMLTEQLKEQTKTNHQLLEKKMMGRMRAMQDRRDYINLLGNFYAYFGGLEQLIQKYISNNDVPDFDLRRKADSLASDIEILGGVLPKLAATDHLPAITNHQEALGALYVIEGSTLGGQIISQMIGRQLNLNEGLSFFKSYGEQTLVMWQRFQAFLNLTQNSPGAATITAANETFLKFSEWFDLNA